MNRDQGKDLVEIVGLVAIVGSLIFLGVEIRQNTQSQERAMHMERVLSATDVYLNQPVLADIYAKVKEVDGLEPLAAAYADRYQLTTAESLLWARNVSRAVWIFHAQFLSDGPSDQLERDLKGMLLYPDVRIAFDLNEDSLMTPEFIEYANSISDEM